MTPKIPKLDLVFAISASPTDNNFGLILNVVDEVTQRFFSDKVRYGLIVFGKDASIKIHFQDLYTDPRKLKKVISSIPSNKDEPALDRALVLAKSLFESEAARKDAQKVGVFASLRFLIRKILLSQPFVIIFRSFSRLFTSSYSQSFGLSFLHFFIPSQNLAPALNQNSDYELPTIHRGVLSRNSRYKSKEDVQPQ